MSILIEREAWINSQLSIARYYGGMTINKTQYRIVPPCDDLVDYDFLKYYARLGRKRFIEILQAHPQATKPYLQGYFDELLQREHKARQKPKSPPPVQLSLFK